VKLCHNVAVTHHQEVYSITQWWYSAVVVFVVVVIFVFVWFRVVCVGSVLVSCVV